MKMKLNYKIIFHFFGLLLLLLRLRIGKSVYRVFTKSDEVTDINYIIAQIGLSACFLIGVVLFYYVKASVENTKTIPKSWKTHFAVLAVFIIFFGFFKPYVLNKDLWNVYVGNIIFAVWGVYILFSSFLLKNIYQKIVDKNEKLTTSESWLLWVFIGNLIIYSAYLIGYFYLYIIGTIAFSVVFYVLLIFLLFKNNRENVFKDIPKKYNSKKIESKEAEDLKVELHSIMLEKQFYKDTNIKLNHIAKTLGVSSHKLSQFLNDNLGKSFTSFINEYRIEEAKKLLKNNNQYTLEAIGFEAGFSSRSTFYATFKKSVGKTPSEFKKEKS